MEQLIYNTSAFKILTGDAAKGRLSHAYMLYFGDTYNLRTALKLFAKAFFPEDKPSLIMAEGLTDLKVYPKPGEKLTAEAAGDIVDDSAIRPVMHGKKLYIISDFDSASPIFQNKLLKVLEEPPEGVYFLLGAASLSPVLVTVKSRVKLLEISPFSQDEIYAALERSEHNPQNALAAQSCGGCLGVAQSIVGGGWYKEVSAAAEKLCGCTTVSAAVTACAGLGDFKLKKELLSEMQRRYFNILSAYAKDENYNNKIGKSAAMYAVEAINKALADIKFNANFSSLIYDLTLNIVARCGE